MNAFSVNYHDCLNSKAPIDIDTQMLRKAELGHDFTLHIGDMTVFISRERCDVLRGVIEKALRETAAEASPLALANYLPEPVATEHVQFELAPITDDDTPF